MSTEVPLVAEEPPPFRTYEPPERIWRWLKRRARRISWKTWVGVVACIAIPPSVWYIWVTVGSSWVLSELKDPRGPAPRAVQTPVAVASRDIASAPVIGIKVKGAETLLSLQGKVGGAAPTASRAASSTEVAFEVVVPRELLPAQEQLSRLGELGLAGDSFGGLNALLSAVAAGLLTMTAWFQHTALKESRATNRRQALDTTFFELLTLTRGLEERFRRPFPQRLVGPNPYQLGGMRIEVHPPSPPAPPPDLVGADAVKAWASALARVIRGHTTPARTTARDQLRMLAEYFHQYIYKPHSGAFGPYFRTLYQTFKLIDGADIPEEDKVSYGKIARGLLSEDAVFLLAANAYGPYGREFIKYIEKFGLLEHMNPQYRDVVSLALALGFSPAATQGGDEEFPWWEEFARPSREDVDAAAEPRELQPGELF